MQTDSGQEWLRLTRLYAEKSDEELLALAADFGNLTEVAQQVLRDEMKRRGLPVPERRAAAVPDNRPIFGRWNQAVAEQNREFDATPDASDEGEGDDPVEYTWKTLLCECAEREEAWQVAEVLRRASIESWIDGPQSQSSLDVRSPQVFVAADQLEAARAVIGKPIPQDVIDQSKEKVEDFEPPTCPKCGASDPVLESGAFELVAMRDLRRALERFGDGGKRGTKPGLKIDANNEERPPGNRAAFPSGRIVPTEASHQNFLAQ
jgi:hypothetical protein